MNDLQTSLYLNSNYKSLVCLYTYSPSLCHIKKSLSMYYVCVKSNLKCQHFIVDISDDQSSGFACLFVL